jgi:hypothetical protein
MRDVLQVAARLLSELCETADKNSLIMAAASEDEERALPRI